MNATLEAKLEDSNFQGHWQKTMARVRMRLMSKIRLGMELLSARSEYRMLVVIMDAADRQREETKE